MDRFNGAALRLAWDVTHEMRRMKLNLIAEHFSVVFLLRHKSLNAVNVWPKGAFAAQSSVDAN